MTFSIIKKTIIFLIKASSVDDWLQKSTCNNSENKIKQINFIVISGEMKGQEVELKLILVTRKGSRCRKKHYFIFV